MTDGSPQAFSAAAVRAAYDAVAADYTASFADDLQRLPVERFMLDTALAERPAAGQRVSLDLGCGPGSVAGYLAANGAPAVGVDLSAGMLREARARVHGLPLVQADLRALPVASASASLAVAYFSIQHLPRADVPAALREVRRVLVGSGVLLLATHLGAGDLYHDTFLGHHIETVGGALYGPDEIRSLIVRAGFRIDLERQRGPLPHEAKTQRIYFLCRVEV